MDVVLAMRKINASNRIASCRILFPNLPRFGMAGKPLPSSNLGGLGIFSSVARLGYTVRRAALVPLVCVLPSITTPGFLTASASSPRTRRDSVPAALPGAQITFFTAATLPQDLVVFSS
jgi:hypothetical protein